MQVELLIAVQEKRKLTNKWIADQAQLSESTVSRILSRKTEPKFEDIVRIAVAMGVSLDALAGIVRIEDAEAEALRVALAEKEAELDALRQETQTKVDFLLGQIRQRDQALAHKDKVIDGLMALLQK